MSTVIRRFQASSGRLPADCHKLSIAVNPGGPCRSVSAATRNVCRLCKGRIIPVRYNNAAVGNIAICPAWPEVLNAPTMWSGSTSRWKFIQAYSAKPDQPCKDAKIGTIDNASCA